MKRKLLSRFSLLLLGTVLVSQFVKLYGRRRKSTYRAGSDHVIMDNRGISRQFWDDAPSYRFRPPDEIDYYNRNSISNSISTKILQDANNIRRLSTMSAPPMTSSIKTSSHYDAQDDNTLRRQYHEGSKSYKKKSLYPLIRPDASRINNILKWGPSPHSVYWRQSTYVCNTVPGFTKEQVELCFKSPESTKIALQGLSLATKECADQLQNHRWNCSSLTSTTNPHSTQMFRKGYRESAFVHAIAAAGVAYTIAKACSQGKLLSCGCGLHYDDNLNYISSNSAEYAFGQRLDPLPQRGMQTSWKWSGCSHNMQYGLKFAKLFLDSREKSTDIPSRINLHNNKVGRMAVLSNMEVQCKCHGLSGSCEMRTCWRSTSKFRKVGDMLKNKFQKAVMIDHSDVGNRPFNRVQKINRRRRKKRNRSYAPQYGTNIDLWYYERSPTYCDSNSDNSIPGTSGRICSRTSHNDSGSCSTLCCGRGYNTIRRVYTTRCQCQFVWCCEVHCNNCTVDEWITVCK